MTKEEKRAYDIEYRAKNRELLKAKKAAYFQKTYDPQTAKIARKIRMPRHIEYCLQPEYKVKKREFDRQLRASVYGEYAECYLLMLDILKEIRTQAPDRTERYRKSGRHQWSPLTYARRRAQREEYRQAYRKLRSNGVDGHQPQKRTMGNAERSTQPHYPAR